MEWDVYNFGNLQKSAELSVHIYTPCGPANNSCFSLEETETFPWKKKAFSIKRLAAITDQTA